MILTKVAPPEWSRDHGTSSHPVRGLSVAAAGADEEQLARAIHEALDTGRVTLRRLRARAEVADLAGALRIERALSSGEAR